MQGVSLLQDTNNLFSTTGSNTLPLCFCFTASRSVVLMRYQFPARELNTSCQEALRLRSRKRYQQFGTVSQLSRLLLLFSFFFLLIFYLGMSQEVIDKTIILVKS